MPTTRINDGEIYYERHGEQGDALVLVHGYTGDVSDWRHQLPEFAPTHRVLIFDNRGHGRTHAPADRSQYSIAHLAADAEALIEHVGFERYHLLGHSMGGAVVQEIALRSPQRLLSLTLHDTGPAFGFRKSGIAQAYMEQRNRLAEEQGMAAVAALPPLSKPSPHATPERSAEERLRMTGMSVDGFIGGSDALNSWEGVRDRVHTIAVPTMVIYGELDSAAIVKASKWLAETIPGAVLECVPEAGHAPQFERPEIFNAALRRHLERNAR